jgi:hypothetical protein
MLFMAIGWLAVLQAVPWGQVIDNAPKVVEAAKKLWTGVSKNSGPDEFEAPDGESSYSSEPQDLSTIRNRLAALEKSATELHKQMLISSELIKTLADQNAQLITHIEVNRIRTAWLTIACTVMSVAALGALVLVLAQPSF